MSWDYEDRLVGITYPSTATNSFSYNAFGARVSKTDSSGTSTSARNGTSVIAPVLSDGSLTYTPGISSRDGSDSTFSHGDIKNSLRQTAESETTSATKHYDAFGNQTTSTGTWHGPFQYGGNFGYQTDPDSNLKLLGHRYYDPSTGRFLSGDRIGFGRNWYSYCKNNPIAYADPVGLAIVQVRYRPVESIGVIWGWHAYVAVIDIDRGGNTWAVSASPNSAGTIEFFPGNYSKGHYDYRPDHLRHPRVTVLRDELPAELSIARLTQVADELQSDKVEYWAPPYTLLLASEYNANSNTAARELLKRAGLARPSSHPVSVPRWDHAWPGTKRRPGGGGRGRDAFPNSDWPEDPWYDPFKKPLP